MSSAQVKYFLVIYDIPRGMADVTPYGNDYTAALDACPPSPP